MICGRPDLGEEYLCQMLDSGQHGHAGTVNPIVRVLAVIRYPRQRAIYWPEVVSEVSPVRGCICRLPFLRPWPRAAARIRGRLRGTPRRMKLWAESAARLQRLYLRRCENAAEREIIQRHLDGDYRARRSARVYKAYELRAAQAAWKEVQQDERELCEGAAGVSSIQPAQGHDGQPGEPV